MCGNACVDIPCVSHEGEKRSAVNTRTECDALRTAVIQCSDGPETFLVCSVLKHSVPGKASQRLVCPFGREEERTTTHPYTHLDLPSLNGLNLQLVYLT
jgi:hypothetical protein